MKSKVRHCRRPFAQAGHLLLALLVFSLVACGSRVSDVLPSVGQPTPTVTVPVELPVVIAVTGRFSDDLLPLLDRQITAFEAANPDMRIELVEAPSSAAKRREEYVNTLVDQDSSIDIFVIEDTWLAAMAAAEKLQPLDEYIKGAEIDVAAFLPASRQSSSLGTVSLALPWLADGGFLYYRRDLLDDHGYTPPADWPDLQRMAVDLGSQEGPPSAFVWQGAAYESLTCSTLEFVWAFGGDVLNPAGEPIFDSPQTRAALHQMQTLISSGASPAAVATYGEGLSLGAFLGGEAAFMRNWSYAWDAVTDGDPQLGGKTGIAPLPASCLVGQNLILSPHSLHPDQAFRFMAFLTAYDQQVDLALHGALPALETAFTDERLHEQRPILADFYAGLRSARPRPQTPLYPQVSEAIYTEVNGMLAGEQDAEETAGNVQRRIESILLNP